MTRKAQIRSILMNSDRNRLIAWFSEERSPERFLFSLLYDPEPSVQARAVETIGLLAAHLANADLERVRRIVRKALWLMNDESGGLLWNGPEVIASVIISVPRLLGEYGRILASFLNEKPFELGAHRAMARLAEIDPEPFRDDLVIKELKNSLHDDQPEIRALAAAALKLIDKHNQ